MEPLTAAAALATKYGADLLVNLTACGFYSGLSEACKKTPLLGKLIQSGKLPTNHHLEKLAHRSLCESFETLARAIVKYPTENKVHEIDLNYSKTYLLENVLRNKKALSSYLSSLSIDSSLLLQVSAKNSRTLTDALHPPLLLCFENYLPAEKWPHDQNPSLPPFLVEYINQGFSDPDRVGQTTSFAKAFASHFLESLKTAKSKNELASLRAFERLEVADLRQSLQELTPSEVVKLTDEQLQNIADSVNHVTIDIDSIEQLVRAELQRVVSILHRPIQETNRRTKLILFSLIAAVFLVGLACILLLQLFKGQAKGLVIQSQNRRDNQELIESNRRIEKIITDVFREPRTLSPEGKIPPSRAQLLINRAKEEGIGFRELEKMLNIAIVSGDDFLQAQALASKGELDKSDQAFKDILARTPKENIRAHLGLGQNAFERGDYEEALKHYQDASTYIKKDTDPSEWIYAHQFVLSALFELKDKRCIGLAAEIVQFFQPHSDRNGLFYAELLNNYGSVLWLIGRDYEGAIEQYKKALKYNPNHAGVLGNYASLLRRRHIFYNLLREVMRSCLVLRHDSDYI